MTYLSHLCVSGKIVQLSYKYGRVYNKVRFVRKTGLSVIQLLNLPLKKSCLACHLLTISGLAK